MNRIEQFLETLKPEERYQAGGYIKKYMGFLGELKRKYTPEESKERAKARSREQYKRRKKE